MFATIDDELILFSFLSLENSNVTIWWHDTWSLPKCKWIVYYFSFRLNICELQFQMNLALFCLVLSLSFSFIFRIMWRKTGSNDAQMICGKSVSLTFLITFSISLFDVHLRHIIIINQRCCFLCGNFSLVCFFSLFFFLINEFHLDMFLFSLF